VAAAPFPVPAGLKLVNYYPAYDGWTYMWERWNPGEIDSDFARIEGLNANAVRVIVQPSAFGFPDPRPVYRQRLAEVIDLAAQHGLAVELTLFDWWHSYRRIAQAERWARELLAPYAGDPRIACIELQNEIDPGNPAAMAWARALLPYLRTISGDTPVTVSVTGGLELAEQLTELRQQLGTSLPDFWSVHYYDKSELAYGVLAATKAAAGSLPLFVGETGYFAGDSDPHVRLRADLEDEQVRFLDSMEAADMLLGLPPIAPWILSDFAPDGSPKRLPSSEYHFGLFRVDGRPKPAAAEVREYFGSGAPDLGFDGGFEQIEAGLRTPEPALWRRRGAAAFALDPTVAHSGAFSVSLSGIRGFATSRATLTTIPAAPWVTPGDPVTLSAWARGSDVTGRNLVSIIWYDGSRNYIGRIDSVPVAAGTSDWTQLQAQAPAPPGAAYVRIVLSSNGNVGTVWFDDVTLAVERPSTG
jgi:hypothetical protein